MSLTKDDIDAVSIILRVAGSPTFSILLTRGGLTKRMGSSDATDAAGVLVTGRTDECFEGFMAALPEELLVQGGVLEDGGREGPRHDWTFEFGGGLNRLTYQISYHWGSASLPDEFADLVVRAERLTHAWYTAQVAEETGEVAPVVPAERPERSAAPASGRPRAERGQPIPATRERIALAVLLDLFALSVPYSLLRGLIGGGEGGGPPGAGLVLFAIVEFVLLQIARRSPGYWLLGISTPLGGKPGVDPGRLARESRATLSVGVGFCGLGVAGLTAWTTYHAAVPYFGLDFPLWLSIIVTLLGSVGCMLAGGLLLRTDARGVWVGGGIAVLALLSSAAGRNRWSDLASAASWPEWAPGVALILSFVVPAMLLAGLYESRKRLAPRSISIAPAPGRPDVTAS